MLSKELKLAISLMSKVELGAVGKSIHRRYKELNRLEDERIRNEIEGFIKRGVILNRNSKKYIESVVMHKVKNNVYGNIMSREVDGDKAKFCLWYREIENVYSSEGKLLWEQLG